MSSNSIKNNLPLTVIEKLKEDTLHSSFIATPKTLVNKKAIINIKNNNFKCFLYSVVCALKSHQLDTNHPCRALQYEKFFQEFKFNEEDFPMKIDNINKFEEDNNLCINVLRWCNDPFYDGDEASITQNPFIAIEYMSKNLNKNNPIINLLLLENEHVKHYTYIKNLNKLMNFRQGNNGNANKRNRQWCPRCLYASKTSVNFKDHFTSCPEFKKNSLTEGYLSKMETFLNDDISTKLKEGFNKVFGEASSSKQNYINNQISKDKIYSEDELRHLVKSFMVVNFNNIKNSTSASDMYNHFILYMNNNFQ